MNLTILDGTVTDIEQGEWKFTTSQELTDDAGKIHPETFSAEKSVFVDYTQYALPEDAIVNRIPLKDGVGAYTDTIAQVVLKDPLLPWYARAGKKGGAPGVALLMLHESELCRENGEFLIQSTVEEVLKPKADVLVPDFRPCAGPTWQKVCHSVCLETAVFDRVAPRAEELPLLAHCRQVEITDKAEMGLHPEGLFSVVLCNRLPEYRAGQVNRYYLFLASLQGHEHRMDGKAARSGKSRIQLIVLDYWSFEVSGSAPLTFRQFVENLPQEDGAEGMLRLPADKPPRLWDGFVPELYHTRTGEEGLCWYRSPLTPVICRKREREGPFFSADSALVYDPTGGVFDTSLAAAWECGRLAALQDQVFVEQILLLRKRARRLLDERMVPEGNRELYVRPEPRDVLRQMEEQKEALLPQLAGELDALSEWLGRLNLLYQIPLHFLLPHRALLPKESIRFFYVDENWLDALVDGAISIGVDCSRQKALNHLIYQMLIEKTREKMQAYRANLYGYACGERTGTMSGFILHSSAAYHWPTMSVQGKGRDGQDLPVLRMQLLSKVHLLVLFDGVVEEVVCEEPQETFQMKVDVEAERFREGTAVLQIDAGKWSGPSAFARNYLTWGDRVIFRKDVEADRWKK